MLYPGLILDDLEFHVELSDEDLSNYDIYLTSPSLQKEKIQNENDLESFKGLGVNGIWEIEIMPKEKKYKNTIVKSWSLNIKDTHNTNTIKNYGRTNDIVGDGTFQYTSQNGQNRLQSLGGRSWGVCLNKKGQLYYNSVDQGFVAKLNNDNTINHVIDDLGCPMIMDFDIDDNLYIPCFEDNNVILLTNEGETFILFDDILKNPTACRFGNYNKDLLYICDSGNHRILEYNIKTENIQIVVGSGDQGFYGDNKDPLEAELNYPVDIDVNENNVLVIADGLNNRIRAVNMSDQPQLICGVAILPNTINTIAGVGPEYIGFDLMDLPSKEEYINSYNINHNVDDENGIRAIDAHIFWPSCPRVDSSGRLWFFDSDNHRIRVIESCGLIYNVGGNTSDVGFRYIGNKNNSLNNNNPLQVDFNRVMDMELQEKEKGVFDIWLADTDNCMIRKIEGIIMKNNYQQQQLYKKDGKKVNLEILDLTEGNIIDGKLGFKSIILNSGTAPAPGELCGSLSILYSLYNINNKNEIINVLRVGTKTPLCLTSMNNFFKGDIVKDNNYRFAYTEPFNCTVPNSVDICSFIDNAVIDVRSLPNGRYLYVMEIDPNGYYFYQNSIPKPYIMIIKLTGSNENRKISIENKINVSALKNKKICLVNPTYRLCKNI
jgi:hypothetical protein